MRLLIVEDSALVRRMYGLVFSRREHEMVEADDGRTALAALAASPQPFDVVLLDLRMPGMDGVAFIRSVRGAPRYRDVPIIVTTSETDSSELLPIYPVPPPQLLPLLQRCWRERPFPSSETLSALAAPSSSLLEISPRSEHRSRPQ